MKKKEICKVDKNTMWERSEYFRSTFTRVAIDDYVYDHVNSRKFFFIARYLFDRFVTAGDNSDTREQEGKRKCSFSHATHCGNKTRQ